MQHLQMRGGERWLAGASEMRRQITLPAVQAAQVPAAQQAVTGAGRRAHWGFTSENSSLRRQSPIAVVKRAFVTKGRLKCQTTGGLSGANL